MAQFPSAEWMDAFCRNVEAQPDAGAVAEGLDGVYRFVIEPAGPLRERHTYDVEIRPDGEGGARARRLEQGMEAPRLTMTATYERWRQLVNGRLDVGLAVMLRRLKISGDLAGLRRDVGSTKPLMQALTSVDTQWLG